MPIILKDKTCCDCGKELLQVHPATKRCDGCKEKQKKAKLKVLVETYKKPKRESEPEPTLASAEGHHLVRIYGMPMNKYLRFIEFEDGSHGTVRVRQDSTLRTGMKIEVVKLPGAQPHGLVGQYNRWGTRVI